MQHYQFEPQDLSRFFRKRLPVILLFAVLGLSIGIGISLCAPRRYRAIAAWKIDPLPLAGVSPEFAGNLVEFSSVQSLAATVTTYPMLFRVGKKCGILPDSLIENIHLLSDRQVAVIERFRDKIQVSADEKSRIITVSVFDHTPGRAQHTANMLAIEFREFIFQERTMHVERIALSVRTHHEACQRDLADIEQKMKSLFSPHSGRQPEEPAQLVEQLAALDDEIQTIQAAITALKTQKNRLTTEDVSGTILYLKTESAELKRLYDRLAVLQATLQEKRAYSTDRHPAVRSLREKIDQTIVLLLRGIDTETDVQERLLNNVTKKKERLKTRLSSYPRRSTRFAQLSREHEQKQKQCRFFAQRLEDIRIAASSLTNNIAINRKAGTPQKPVPRKGLVGNAGAGLLIGFLAGFLFGVVREMFDTTFSTFEDVERSLNMPVLSIVPSFAVTTSKRRARTPSHPPSTIHRVLVTHFKPADRASEAYRILRTAARFQSSGTDMKTLLISSAIGCEGKTTTALNLAIACGQQGLRVALVECDLRHPSLATILGIDNSPGLADVLNGKKVWHDCLRTVTDMVLQSLSIAEVQQHYGLTNCRFLTAGSVGFNAEEHISSPVLGTVLREMREEFDIVILDTPPILPVADPVIVARHADAAVIVFRAENTPREALRLCCERLAVSRIKVLGVVFNDVRGERGERG